MPATPDTSEASQAYAEALHRLLPFHFFYEKLGQELPDFCFLDGDEVPYPYRSLLVHKNDMTPTLAAFHHSKLYLEVHRHEISDELVIRLVTLHAAESEKPVEYGAIAIQLDQLAPPLRDEIIAGKKPLGGLLAEYEVEHSGEPSRYFSVPADPLIAGALQHAEGDVLYGRCNQLLNRDGIAFADIVEILPRSDESEKWVKS